MNPNYKILKPGTVLTHKIYDFSMPWAIILEHRPLMELTNAHGSRYLAYFCHTNSFKEFWFYEGDRALYVPE